MSAKTADYKKSTPYTGDLPGEEWRAIPGYEGTYEVSNLGRVRAVRVTMMRPSLDGKGYMCLSLCDNYKSKKKAQVQRLVCTAFHGAPAGSDLCARHLNGVSTDNRAENIAWGTQQENVDDKVRHGRQFRGEQSPGAQLSDALVKKIRDRIQAGESTTAVARDLGFSVDVVSRAANGTTWAHIPGALPRQRRFGGKHYSKLTDTQVTEIRARYDGGEHPTSIAPDYDVCKDSVRMIGKRLTWRHIP